MGITRYSNRKPEVKAKQAKQTSERSKQVKKHSAGIRQNGQRYPRQAIGKGSEKKADRSRP